MKRAIVVIAAATLLLVTLAAPASAGYVFNERGSAEVVQGSWWSESGDSSTYGSAYAWAVSGGESFLEVYEQSGQWVQCDPTGEFWGFVGTWTYGYGPASVTIGRHYGTGSATGTVQLFTSTVNECAGEYSEVMDSANVTIDMTGSGSLYRSRSSGSFKVPGEFNDNYSSSSVSRSATGTVAFGGRDIAAQGEIGKITWRSHSNG